MTNYKYLFVVSLALLIFQNCSPMESQKSLSSQSGYDLDIPHDHTLVGDMIVHKDLLIRDGEDVTSYQGLSKKNIEKWPDGILPIQFFAGYSEEMKSNFLRVCNELRFFARVKCVKRTTEKDYIIVRPSKDSESCGYSYVGKLGGPQVLGLKPECEMHRTTIQHELLHALGFVHEQSRSDRDDFITIHWENILPERQRQFRRLRVSQAELLSAYDFESIMHYSSYAYSANGQPVMERKQPEKTSFGDIYTIRFNSLISEGDRESLIKAYGVPENGHAVLDLSSSLVGSPKFVEHLINSLEVKPYDLNFEVRVNGETVLVKRIELGLTLNEVMLLLSNPQDAAEAHASQTNSNDSSGSTSTIGGVHGSLGGMGASSSKSSDDSNEEKPASNPSGIVVGHIDQVSLKAKQTVIKGWACEQYNKVYTTVHVYVGGASGKGTHIATAKASKTSESAVNDICVSGLSAHRFEINMDNVKLMPWKGQKIYVHGLSQSPSHGNPLLKQSGSFSVSNEIGNIQGDVWSVKINGDNTEISGWTCESYNGSSIEAHVYAGGPKGTGKLIGKTKASLGTGSWVDDRCHSGIRAHTFKLTVSNKSLQHHLGQKIHVYGFSPGNPKSSKEIHRSGQHSIPRAASGQVIGWVDSAQFYFFAVFKVTGWVCEKNRYGSSYVHIYAGGWAGKGGTHIATAYADQASEPAVAAECGTNYTAYRFTANIPATTAYQFYGKPVYVHGLSYYDIDTNPLLRGSGNHYIK